MRLYKMRRESTSAEDWAGTPEVYPAIVPGLNALNALLRHDPRTLIGFLIGGLMI
jgi:hypothetical protein